MDIPPIQPSFYYTEGNIPVFTPTEEQFNDFNRFIDQVLPYGQKAGLIKVIPPATWSGRALDIDSKLKHLKIKKSIQQNFFGSSGIYKQTNIESRKKFTVDEFRELASSKTYCPPKISKAPPETPRRSNGTLADRPTTPLTPPNSSPEVSSPSSTTNTLETDAGKGSEATCAPKSSPVKPKTVFDDSKLYQLLLSNLDLKEIERHYWRNISFVPPYYGADLLGNISPLSFLNFRLAF